MLLVSEKICKFERSCRNNCGDGGVCSRLEEESANVRRMISSVVKVLREGRKGGARDFYITSDFNVELGLMCTGENDEEELTKLYGPLCWQGYDKDLGGLKKSCGMGL